jgi:Holliday junction resolvase RusA-like endonuclease
MILLDTVLPGLPPPLNHAYTHTARGGKRMTAEAAAWQAGAALALRVALVSRPAPRTPLRVAITFTAPDILRWDLDGRLKQLGDALATALGVDDRYVLALTVSKARGPIASTRVQVEAWEAQAA